MSVNSKKKQITNLPEAYLQEENAIAWLRKELDENGFTKKAAYHLSILCNLINNEENIFKRLPEEILGGLSKGQRKNVEASLVARAYEAPVRPGACGFEKHIDESPFVLWDRQERALENWARQDGCWHDDIIGWATSKYGEEISHGNEARVFRYDGTHVAKVWLTHFEPQKNLDRISLTNERVPETGYELLGAGRTGDGVFCYLVKQPFIQGEPLNTDTVCIPAFDGFERVEEDRQDNPKYTTDRYVIGDLHDRNVIRDIDGNDRVIDFNIELNTPELGLGGKWEIPSVSCTEEGLAEIDSFLDSIVPRQEMQDKLETVIDRVVPDFSAQLRRTGRYEGTVTLPLKDGTKASYVMQSSKSADGKNVILYTKPESILNVIGTDGRFNEKEKRKLSEGKSLIKDDKKYVFDTNTGRVRALVVKGKTKTLSSGKRP